MRSRRKLTSERTSFGFEATLLWVKWTNCATRSPRLRSRLVDLRSRRSLALDAASPCRSRPRQGRCTKHSMELRNHPWRDAEWTAKGYGGRGGSEHLIEHDPSAHRHGSGRAFGWPCDRRERLALFATLAPMIAPPSARAMPTATSRSASTRRQARSPSTFQTAGHDGAPSPRSRARPSIRAHRELAVAEMQPRASRPRGRGGRIRGWSVGMESLSSSQVSRGAKLSYDELEQHDTAARGEVDPYSSRPLRKKLPSASSGTPPCSRLEGFGPDERSRVRATPIALGGWRCIGGPFWRVSRPAVCAGSNTVSPTIMPGCGPRAGRCSAARQWHRRQFHLAGNAIRHATNLAILQRIGVERAPSGTQLSGKGRNRLGRARRDLRDTIPKLAARLAENAPKVSPSSRASIIDRRGCAPPPDGALPPGGI